MEDLRKQIVAALLLGALLPQVMLHTRSCDAPAPQETVQETVASEPADTKPPEEAVYIPVKDRDGQVQIMELATMQIPSMKEISMVVIPYMVMIIPVIPVGSLMADMQKHLSCQQHSPAPMEARCSGRLATA